MLKDLAIIKPLLSKNRKLSLCLLAGVAWAGWSVFLPEVAAQPKFMDLYNRATYAREDLRDKCTVCHIGRGGGERNRFGDEFEAADYKLTPELRAKYPRLFQAAPK